jgi:hypothetical protein
MSKYAIEDSTLTSIADAIRSKAGTTEALKPVDMPEAIAAIQAGGGSSEEGTGFAAYVEGTSNVIGDSKATKIRNNFLKSASLQNSITGVDFPNATEVGEFAFYENKGIETINLPKAQIIGNGAFMYVWKIKELVLPEVVTIEASAFYCSNANIGDLEKIDLGKNIQTIKGNAFCYHKYLKTLILRSNSVCTLAATGALSNTAIKSGGSGYIYVPAALVEEYKAATNWSSFKNQIRAIENYPDICGEVV